MPSNPAPNDTRCEFRSSDGRRCRLSRADGHASLCSKHWRRDLGVTEREHLNPEADAAVAELLGSKTDLRTDTAVNDALAKLFTLRARKLLGLRDTAILAYIVQLLLQTLHGTEVEFKNLHGSRAWDRILEKAIQDSLEPRTGLRGAVGSAPALAARAPSLPSGKRGKVAPKSRRKSEQEVLAAAGNE